MKLVIEETNYPKAWNTEHFKSLPTFKARVLYAKEKLGHLGSGSARIVFDINDNTVLKLAKNKKGLAQNELEADISDSGYYKDIIARVNPDHDPNYLWIESEKARKMTPKDFSRLVGGYDFQTFAMVLVNEHGKTHQGRKTGQYYVDPSIARNIYNDEFFDKVLSFISDFDLAAGDFGRISSWGIVNRKGKGDIPVLIDYGVSQTIFQDFYLKRKI